MKRIVKSFNEFINEAKVDDIISYADENSNNQEEYNEILLNQLNDNIDHKAFLEYFSQKVYDTIIDSFEVEYEAPYKDEDGNMSGGYDANDVSINELELNDNPEFEEYDINFSYENGGNNKDEFIIYAFGGELDLTESDFGEAMKDVFYKVYEKAKEGAISKGADILSDDTYKTICRLNGWNY